MKFKRIIALSLSAVMLISSITACNTQNIPDDPSSVFVDIKSESEILYNAEGKLTVNLFTENEIISDDITPQNITIMYGKLNRNVLTDIDAQNKIELNDEEFKTIILKPDSVTKTGEHSLTVSFTDRNFLSNKPDEYVFILDENSNSANKHLCCNAKVTYPTCSVVSDTTSIMAGTRNVNLTLTLDKGVFSDDISIDDLTLSDGLKDCTITKAEKKSDNVLGVTLSCPETIKAQNGFITVKGDSLSESAFDISTAIRVISPFVTFDMDEFEATDNFSRIKLTLNDCTFNDSVSKDSFSCDNENIEISRFDKTSQNEGTLYLSFDMESVEEAVEQLESSSFTLSNSGLNINNSLSFEITPYKPHVSACVTGITEEGGDFKVTACLTVVYGSFNSVSKNSFVFGGDYSKAEIKSITSEDNKINITFVIPKTSSVETAQLNGTIALRKECVTSKWGEYTVINSFPVYFNYADENVSLEGADFDYQQLIDAYSVLYEYAMSNSVKEPSDIVSLMEYQGSKGKFDIISKGVFSNKKYLQKINTYLSDTINSASSRGGSSKVVTEFLNQYLSEVNVLSMVSSESVADINQLYSLIKKLETTTYPQENEILNSDISSLSNEIISSYKHNLYGKSITEMREIISDGFYDTGIAILAFDRLVDRLFNWSAQSYELKILFRYYVATAIFNSSLLEIYAREFSLREGQTSDPISLVRPLTLEATIIEKPVNTGNGVYSNIIGKELKIGSAHTRSDTISQSILSTNELNQIIANSRANTLLDELAFVGYDMTKVRYLICRDSPINSETTSAYIKQGNEYIKTYTVTIKATVYDLYTSSYVNDFEYYNVTFNYPLSKTGELDITVKKLIGVYTLE